MRQNILDFRLLFLNLSGRQQMRISGVKRGGTGDFGFAGKLMACNRHLHRQGFVDLIFGLAGGHQA
ncbi:hypothetical protein SRABI106_04107 [Rahnella aquatilis]|nr:hypothetical protein SRABI106_04107 [Rahnella aquatilis]